MRRIKSSHPESQGPFVLIEDDDFDPETMEEYSEPNAETETETEAEAEAGQKRRERQRKEQ